MIFNNRNTENEKREKDRRRRAYCLLLPAVLLFSAACKKNNPENEPPAPSVLGHGILVLNEGLFNQNNASLSWVDAASGGVNNSFFEEKAGRGLGDTGNDMKRYGGKIYLVVSVSSTVEVLDARTGSPLQQIPMMHNGVPKQPRSLTFYGAHAYVTCYDGFVDVIDTASLSVVQRIPVGENPEGLAVSNGKLYVANSGGLNFPEADSTVSVIDLATHTELLKIPVGYNPGGVCTDSEGDIYVISRGDYGNIPSRMHRIDPATDTKAQSFGFDAGGVTRMNDHLLVSYYDHGSGSSQIGLFDALSEQMIQADFISTGGITTLYGVAYSSITNTIYCSDGNGFTNTGFVHLFNSNGVFQQTYNVGLNPSKILVYE